MNEKNNMPDGTNPYPIYPNLDEPVRPSKNGRIGRDELEQEVDLVNPDPDSLDRG